METGTVLFAIHSVTQSRCINKKNGPETFMQVCTLYPNGATHLQQRRWRQWQLGGSAVAAEAEAQRQRWRWQQHSSGGSKA